MRDFSPPQGGTAYRGSRMEAEAELIYGVAIAEKSVMPSRVALRPVTLADIHSIESAMMRKDDPSSVAGDDGVDAVTRLLAVTHTPSGGPPKLVALSDIRVGGEWFLAHAGFALVHLIIVAVEDEAAAAEEEPGAMEAELVEEATAAVALVETPSRGRARRFTFDTLEEARQYIAAWSVTTSACAFDADVAAWVAESARLRSPAAEAAWPTSSAVPFRYRDAARRCALRRQRPTQPARLLLRAPPAIGSSGGDDAGPGRTAYATLARAVEVTPRGDGRVVHGHGVVARRSLRMGEQLWDPLALFRPGRTPGDAGGGAGGAAKSLALSGRTLCLQRTSGSLASASSGYFDLRDFDDPDDDDDDDDDNHEDADEEIVDDYLSGRRSVIFCVNEAPASRARVAANEVALATANPGDGGYFIRSAAADALR